MKRYKPFSVTMFLEDRNRWDKEIKSKELELSTLRGLNSVDGQGRSSLVSKPTEIQALKCNQLETEISRCKMYKTAWEYARRQLDEREMELVEGFFGKKHRYINVFVHEYERKYAVCTKQVYNDRRNMLKHIYNVLKDAGFDVL